MELLFSTAQVHPRDRFDYWHSVACKQIVDHDSRPETRTGFEAEIRAGSVGHLGLIQFRNSPMLVTHTKVHVSHTRPDDVFLCRQISGVAIIEQDTREVSLDVGPATLVDPLLPYRVKFLKGSTTLVVKVPRRELEARLGKTQELTARLIPLDRPEDVVTASVLEMMPTVTGKMSPAAAEMMGNLSLDLIAISLTAPMGGLRALSSPRAATIMRLRAVIEARLSDHNLDTSTVAAAAGVSVRYANDVLAEQGTSISRLILTRRLARCRSALADAMQAHRTISEIAHGWGFSDMTHFGRRFKQAYGTSPSEYQSLSRCPERLRSEGA
ncbi:helix-turn-helix domain-containing protein [Bradyrhizobium sp. UFLA05-153]